MLYFDALCLTVLDEHIADQNFLSRRENKCKSAVPRLTSHHCSKVNVLRCSFRRCSPPVSACYSIRGHQCIFPFIGPEDGITYYNCTSLDIRDIMQPYCATGGTDAPYATVRHVRHSSLRYVTVPRYVTVRHGTSQFIYVTVHHGTSQSATVRQVHHSSSKTVTVCHSSPRYVAVHHGTSQSVTVRHNLPRYLTICHGTSQSATVSHRPPWLISPPRYVTVRHGTSHFTVRHGTSQLAAVRHSSPRYVTLHSLQCYVTVRCGPSQFTTVRHSRGN